MTHLVSFLSQPPWRRPVWAAVCVGVGKWLRVSRGCVGLGAESGEPRLAWLSRE